MPQANRRPRPMPAWLLPLLYVGAAAAAFSVVRRAPAAAFAWVAGGLLALVVLWILVSVLWPARADRACPGCGAEAVERLEAHSSVGRRCRACGWHDATESSWLLAEEEEEALERLVLEQRRSRRHASQASRVDRTVPAD